MWNELKAKYDPEEKYTKKYEDQASKEGISLWTSQRGKE